MNLPKSLNVQVVLLTAILVSLTDLVLDGTLASATGSYDSKNNIHEPALPEDNIVHKYFINKYSKPSSSHLTSKEINEIINRNRNCNHIVLVVQIIVWKVKRINAK